MLESVCFSLFDIFLVSGYWLFLVNVKQIILSVIMFSRARGHACPVVVLVSQLEKKRLLYAGEKSYIGLLGKF